MFLMLVALGAWMVWSMIELSRQRRQLQRVAHDVATLDRALGQILAKEMIHDLRSGQRTWKDDVSVVQRMEYLNELHHGASHD
jgi:hypothetical protein